MIAAANFTYLIGISLPSVAVLLLRRNEPDRDAALPRPARHDRARRRRRLRVAARHLPRLRAVRPADRAAVARARLRRLGVLRLAARHRPPPRRPAAASSARCSLKLTGAMVAVMALDGAGYLLAVSSVDGEQARADLAAAGHLRRGRDPHDHRRPRPPGHHRPGGRADLRRRRAPGHRHARRPDAGDARAQHRRPRRAPRRASTSSPSTCARATRSARWRAPST